MWRAWPTLTFDLWITNKEENKHLYHEKEEWGVEAEQLTMC